MVKRGSFALAYQNFIKFSQVIQNHGFILMQGPTPLLLIFFALRQSIEYGPNRFGIWTHCNYSQFLAHSAWSDLQVAQK